MKPRSPRRKVSAVTLLEVLVLVAVMALIAGILLPALQSESVKAPRISCVNNLKNVGLAYRIFTTDNGGQRPWQLSGTNGTKDTLADPGSAWRHFQFISNELSSSRILVCPSDKERRVATDFSGFGPENLSYFLGLEGDENIPESILGGDRNLTTNGADVGPGLLLLGTNQNAGFSKKIHKYAGNVLLGDGSVQQTTSGRFQEAVVAAAVTSTNAVNRLLIP
jgi:type II secretory pathway pseudopilin PulG